MERTGFVELPSDNKPDGYNYYYGEVVDAVEAEPEEDGDDREDSDSSSDSEDGPTGSGDS